MPYTTDDVLKQLRHARGFLLKHLDGLTDEQWSSKPNAGCKSPLETLAHLIADDRCALDCLTSGTEPDYSAYDEPVTDRQTLLARLASTHEQLCAYIAERYGGATPDTEVCIYGQTGKLGGLTYLASEDYYHAGQIAYVRLAADPAWDYYAQVYGGM
jgi:hypothetical protein